MGAELSGPQSSHTLLISNEHCPCMTYCFWVSPVAINISFNISTCHVHLSLTPGLCHLWQVPAGTDFLMSFCWESCPASLCGICSGHPGSANVGTSSRMLRHQNYKLQHGFLKGFKVFGSPLYANGFSLALKQFFKVIPVIAMLYKLTVCCQ